MLGGAQLAVGAAAIFARYALTASGPLAVAALRLCIAAAILLAIASVRRPERLDRRSIIGLVAAGLALAVHFGSWIASLQYTSVAVSALLVSLAPLWNVLYDAIVTRKPPARTTAFALGAGLAGLALIAAQHDAPAPVPHASALGALLAVAGSIAFAAYLILVRPVRAKRDTRTIITVTYGVAAIVLALCAAAAHQAPPPVSAQSAWGGILAMALLSQLLGHTGMNAALRWFPSTTVSFSTLLEPVIATVIAWFLFGEHLGVWAGAGAVLILASLTVLIWIAPKPELD
jgi:drug/metabolite transporter (DMT)-like permease